MERASRRRQHFLKILITGGTGLLGRSLEQLALSRGHTVIALHGRSELDLANPSDVESFNFSTFDSVVHCAARLSGVAGNLQDPAAAVTDNLVMSARLFEAVAKSSPQPSLVFISSSTIYPQEYQGSVVATEDWPLSPEPIYQGVAGVKIYLESLLSFYRDKFELRSTIVRPTAIYGPGDQSGHVISDLIQRAGSGEVPLSVWGSPDTVRDFVYVDDVAAGVLATLNLLQERDFHAVFNLGSGTRVTIAELAAQVLQSVYTPETLASLEDRHSGRLIRFDPSKPSAIKIRQVSIARAKRVLGWSPRVSLTEGLARTVARWRGMNEVTPANQELD